MQTKSKSFVKSNVNQVIKQTAREPNCTIITVSTGKGFSHFLYLLTNKGCDSSLSRRSSSKMAKPVKTPNASEECFEVENDIHKFPFGTLFLFSISNYFNNTHIYPRTRGSLVLRMSIGIFEPQFSETKTYIYTLHLHTSKAEKHTFVRLFTYICTQTKTYIYTLPPLISIHCN